MSCSNGLALWFAITLCLTASHSTANTGTSELNVTFMVSGGEQRQIYLTLAERFEQQNPGIEIIHREYEQEAYKASIEEWLSGSQPAPDILFWFAGKVLEEFARKEYLRPISDLWEKNDWDNNFPQAIRDIITVDGQAIALPVAFYHWGIYYRPSLFRKLNLTPPETWEDFLRVGETLLENEITPVTVGSEAGWPMAAWFDYLNLRINGLTFHQQLTAGKISFHDPRVRKVMEYWQGLVQRGFFLEDHARLDWRSALPYLYQNAAGMLLMGGFVKPHIPPLIHHDIDFIPFPTINPHLPRFENAPTDVFIIPANARNPNNAASFIEFLAEPETQAWLNGRLGTTAPALNARQQQGQQEQRILGEAAGFAQFFDRDSSRRFSTAAMPIFVEFTKGDLSLSDTLEKLETARQASQL